MTRPDRTERSSAGALRHYLPGQSLGSSHGYAWHDLLMQIFVRVDQPDALLVPAVPEPMIVWILAGEATVEERELDGAWQSHRVRAGDFFLTHAARPYELKWRTEHDSRFEVVHLYLAPSLLERVAEERAPGTSLMLRDVSGASDPLLSSLMLPLCRELQAMRAPSGLFVQGLAQSLAVHLARHYGQSAPARPRGGLPAFKLRRVIDHMQGALSRPFALPPLARLSGLSSFHFCRAFKQSTGYAPSRYFIHLRIEHARRLLRETQRPVIDVALEVGYASASHFSQVFKREVGATPSAYRVTG